MQTLVSTAAALALAATALVAAPAAAQVAPGGAAAILHFNQDYDGQDDRRSIRNVGQGVAVSTRSGGRTRAVFDHFNADFDSQDNVRGLNGATRFASQPSRAAEIFARIRRESREDE